DDLTRFNHTAHYTAPGWNDRNSRGNGSYRTDAILTVWSRWKSDQSQAFSYGMAGWVKNAQIKGKIFNVRPFITYTPTDNISIDAEVMYRKTDNWQIWQEDNRINTFNSDQMNIEVKSTWIIDNAQEVRVAMQWVGLKAQAQDAYRISNQGDLYLTGETRAANFAQADLALQVRYKYQFAPLSDLYLVYSRGGNTFNESQDEQQGFNDLISDSFAGKNADQLTMKVRYRF
ncbi:MAG: hypothetical protein HRT35_37530, partial [Algicola sp.]|nr:hypothetical protein [Algicola sp.]